MDQLDKGVKQPVIAAIPTKIMAWQATIILTKQTAPTEFEAPRVLDSVRVETFFNVN